METPRAATLLRLLVLPEPLNLVECLSMWGWGKGSFAARPVCFIGEVGEAGCDIGIDGLGHGDLHWLRLGLLRCSQHLGRPTFLCYHSLHETAIRDNTQKEAPRSPTDRKG